MLKFSSTFSYLNGCEQEIIGEVSILESPILHIKESDGKEFRIHFYDNDEILALIEMLSAMHKAAVENEK